MPARLRSHHERPSATARPATTEVADFHNERRLRFGELGNAGGESVSVLLKAPWPNVGVLAASPVERLGRERIGTAGSRSSIARSASTTNAADCGRLFGSLSNSCMTRSAKACGIVGFKTWIGAG